MTKSSQDIPGLIDPKILDAAIRADLWSDRIHDIVDAVDTASDEHDLSMEQCVALGVFLSAAPKSEGAVPGEPGWKLVPEIPTEDQWGGLARSLVMWWGMSDRPTGQRLYAYLKLATAQYIPTWLYEEIPDIDHVPPKGTVAACIYRAMLAAAPSNPLPAAREEVGVKPLEWELDALGWWTAVNTIGRWNVHDSDPGLDQRKAAAQADYETRIRSALSHPQQTEIADNHKPEPIPELGVEHFLAIMSEWEGAVADCATVSFEDFGNSRSPGFEIKRPADELRMFLRNLRAFIESQNGYLAPPEPIPATIREADNGQ